MKNAGGVCIAAMAHEEGQVPVSGAEATLDGSDAARTLLQARHSFLQLSATGSIISNMGDAGGHDGVMRRASDEVPRGCHHFLANMDGLFAEKFFKGN